MYRWPSDVNLSWEQWKNLGKCLEVRDEKMADGKQMESRVGRKKSLDNDCRLNEWTLWWMWGDNTMLRQYEKIYTITSGCNKAKGFVLRIWLIAIKNCLFVYCHCEETIDLRKKV